jgi:hypothetical protein
MVRFSNMRPSIRTNSTIVPQTPHKLYHHVRHADLDTQRWWDEACKAADGCLGLDDLEKKRAELFDVEKKG